MADKIMLRPEVRSVVSEILTDKQNEVFLLALAGYSEHRIAEIIERSRGTVRDHLDAAYRKLRKAGIRFHPNGEPYLDGRANRETEALLRSDQGG